MPTYRDGRHEHGQNFLNDHHPVADAIVAYVAATSGPIVEIGAGAGVLTRRLERLGRPLTAVEIDEGLVRRLEQRVDPRVQIVHGDFLHHRLPQTAHVLTGNLPFHQTTAMLRRVLRAPGWTDAVMLVQWEVARRRAGVGGSTLMTAQWSPWFTFELGQRVPARAFTPSPGVDGGLLTITRRPAPLLPRSHRKAFHTLTHRIYTGRGRGFAEIAARAGFFRSTAEARRWATSVRLSAHALPKELSPEQWTALFHAVDSTPPRRRR